MSWHDEVLSATQVVERFHIGPWCLDFDDETRPPRLVLSLPPGATIRRDGGDDGDDGPDGRRLFRCFKCSCAGCAFRGLVFSDANGETKVKCPRCDSPPKVVDFDRQRGEHKRMRANETADGFVVSYRSCEKCDAKAYIVSRREERHKKRQCTRCDETFRRDDATETIPFFTTA